MIFREFESEFLTFLSESDIPAEKFHDPEIGFNLIKCTKDIFFHLNMVKDEAGIYNQANTIEYERQGRNLIQIWEDQWNFHNDIIKNRILVLLGKAKRIYARETEIVKLTNPQLIEFLKKNHLNVPLKAKIKFGLVHGEELVSVLSLSNPRTFDLGNKKIRSYEILRFCHLKGYLVVGGLSKLMKHFIREYQPDHIMTYIDREWGHGKGFQKIGFQGVGHIEKRSLLIKKDKSERKYLTQKKTLTKLEQIDFFQVYNSGSIKMELSING